MRLLTTTDTTTKLQQFIIMHNNLFTFPLFQISNSMKKGNIENTKTKVSGDDG